MSDEKVQPEVSIVIPVYNEEAILHAAVVDLVDRLSDVSWSYELVLAENGSTDRTAEIALELCERFGQITYRHTPEPNYGRALRDGILTAQGEFIVCDEIDLCDTSFHQRAIDILRTQPVDMVIGSKVMKGAEDKRPWLRRVGTIVINYLLRLLLGFRGTDTHGLKAFRRAPLDPIAAACVVDRDLFASEFVIRAERAELRVLEIPVRILEMRPPTVGLCRRVPNVLTNLFRLFVAIRMKR